MKLSRHRLLLALLVGAISLAPRMAYAYLDPGTGSYIIQILIGTLLGGLFAVGVFWRRLATFVKRLFARKKNGGPGRD